MITVTVRSEQGAYPVWVGPSLIDSVGPLLVAAGLTGRVVVVADETVRALYGERLLASLPNDTVVIEIPSGEASKTLPQAERIWTRLAEAGMGRRDTLLALGGGVAGDLGGFIAATWHRGMAFVQVPTTLLAQVDSSVGGKVAIDHPLGKNLIGAFHAPRLVLADTDTLATLPLRERWSGLAEVAKAALLADHALLSLLEVDLEALVRGQSDRLGEVLAQSIRIKASIVQEDEHEHDRRRVLNFGHTVGHGIEAACGFSMPHGEAVVMGMRAALHLSRRLTSLSEEEEVRALALLSRFPSPPGLVIDPEEVLAATRRDKKAVGDQVAFVCLRGIGEPEIVQVGEGLLREAISVALRESP